jgi:hypothetical protein
VDAQTPATRAAAQAGLVFDVVTTERPTSAEESAALQGISLGQLLRTIVVRRRAATTCLHLRPEDLIASVGAEVADVTRADSDTRSSA